MLAGTVLLAAATRQLDLRSHFEGWPLLLCASLGLIPILILYGVSLADSVQIFVFRYRLVAIPGIALCWALIVNRIDSRALRLLFCMAIVATTVYELSTTQMPSNMVPLGITFWKLPRRTLLPTTPRC